MIKNKKTTKQQNKKTTKQKTKIEFFFKIIKE